MKKLLSIIPVAIIIFMSSCNKNIAPRSVAKRLVPYTKEMDSAYKFAKVRPNIQFFNGPAPIRMQNLDTLRSATITRKGKVLFHNNHDVFIPAYAKATFQGKDKSGNFKYSFNKWDPSYYLVYNIDKGDTTDSDKTYNLITLPDGGVWYGKPGKNYYTMLSGEGFNIYIDSEIANRLLREKGRRVGR